MPVKTDAKTDAVKTGKSASFEALFRDQLDAARERGKEVEQILSSFDLDLYIKHRAEIKVMLSFFGENRSSTPDHPCVLFIDRMLHQDAASIIYMEVGKREVSKSHNALVMRYVGGMKYREIAVRMHCTTRAVYKYVNAAIDRLLILVFGVDGIPWNSPEPKDIMTKQ